MGIINPRPALRRAGIRRIKTNLRDHANHMARFIANGMTREAASAEAFRMVKAGVPTEPKHFMQVVDGNPNPQPLRPYCKACGWRKGGPDSWDGTSCKCGHNEPPIRVVEGGPA